jgi:DNA-3-methyladenine glycosylase II
MNHTTQLHVLVPQGPFALADACARFGGWPSLPGDPAAPILAFPVEGADAAAAVVLRQRPDGAVESEVFGVATQLAERARAQALATLSLDVDGGSWPALGERDPALGELQRRYAWLRPVLFHSPYEAAVSFVLGHRISIVQVRRLRARLAEDLGARVEVAGASFPAFPSPARLLAASDLPGVPPAKAERLCAIAAAAEDGWLRRDALRALAPDEALARLQTLPGVGSYFATAILLRGAGLVDRMAPDGVALRAAARLRGLPAPVGEDELQRIAEAWAPYRTWAGVLLHVWLREEGGLPTREDRAGYTGSSAARARSSVSRSRSRSTR